MPGEVEWERLSVDILPEMPKTVTRAWVRWILGTVAWAVGSCAVVAIIWGPDPLWLAATAVISVAISYFLGNRLRS